MKKQHILSSLIISLSISSCGLLLDDPSSDSGSGVTSESIMETKAPEMKHEIATETDDLFKDAETSEATKSDAPSNITQIPEETAPAVNEERPIVVDEPKPIAVEEKPAIIEESKPIITEEKIEIAEDTKDPQQKTYEVKKGDTLMQIAFKLYGDISRWKELKQMNNSKLSSNSSLKARTILKYMAPAKEFVWNPTGTPYLIKNGETLGTISDSVYQTPKYWKKIWENNKPLIKNPNIIYAGFTLYYKPMGEMAIQKNNIETINIDEEINNVQSASKKQ